jgi:hypothetical protein
MPDAWGLAALPRTTETLKHGDFTAETTGLRKPDRRLARVTSEMLEAMEQVMQAGNR